MRLNSVEVGHIANVSGAAAEESDIHCGKRSARLRLKRCKREKTLLLSWGRFNLIKKKRRFLSFISASCYRKRKSRED